MSLRNNILLKQLSGLCAKVTNNNALVTAAVNLCTETSQKRLVSYLHRLILIKQR